MVMSDKERKSGTFNQGVLFRSAQSADLLPHQHRSSIIEVLQNDKPSVRPSLIQALLESHPEQFEAATQTPFLQLAGAGKISKETLSTWLSQDRLYAETYICFISSLIARVSLPYAFVSDKSHSLRWRIIDMLTGALDNIKKEIDFFTSTAQKYHLDLEYNGEDSPNAFMPNQATQQYMDIFRGFLTDPSLPLIEGLVVLWATEYCYLSAWTYASQFANESPAGNDADGGALREAFIPNWTSEEFRLFVDEIAELTNLLAEREQVVKKLPVYQAVWSHVLDVEQSFWPKIEASDR